MGTESQGAYAAARAQGLDVPDKPDNEMPEMPSDLTELSDQDLMQLYSQIIAWSDFIAVQQSFAQTDERRIKRRLEFLEAKALIRARTVTDKITDARTNMKADPDVAEAHDTAGSAEAYRKLIEALYSNLERDAALISRELTRRTTSERGRRDKWTA
jgi:hypothetical protein